VEGSIAAAPFARVRTRVVPTWVWLGAIVAGCATLRWWAALAHAMPAYIPDEYLYASLGRSLGEHGTVAVRGEPAAFPALLQPILTAPFWRIGSVHTAITLVKALNALAMAAGALPVYLVARKAGLERAAGLLCAFLAALSPNLYFVSFVLSNPISYPLALGAVAAALAVLERPSVRAQVAFLAFAGLAAFASVQFAVLPFVLLGAALVVERGRIRTVVRQLRLTLGLLAAGGLVFLVRPGSVGFYHHAPHLLAKLGAGSWLHWTSLGGFLLALSAGACFLPGAVAATAAALRGRSERRERAFASVLVGLVVALLAEAAPLELDTRHFEERYLLVLGPLVPVAFLLWRKQGFPLRAVAGAIAGALLLTLPFVPLTTYALRDGPSDSPFLTSVAYLLTRMPVGQAALLASLGASVLALAALLLALRPGRAGARVCVVLGGAWLVAVSLASTSLANTHAQAARDQAPANLRWVDNAGAKDVTLVSSYGAQPYAAIVTLFWNPRSIVHEATLGRGGPLDPFGTTDLRAGQDGRLLLGGAPLTTPFLLDDTATAVGLTGARAIARTGDYTLWQPQGTPRLRMLAEGFRADGFLEQTADVRLWPAPGSPLRGTLRLRFRLLPGMPSAHLMLTAPGFRDEIDLRPGALHETDVPVHARGPATLAIVARGGVATNGGPSIAALAAPPVFVPAR
jgi:hypothetical protein